MRAGCKRWGKFPFHYHVETFAGLLGAALRFQEDAGFDWSVGGGSPHWGPPWMPLYPLFNT